MRLSNQKWVVYLVVLGLLVMGLPVHAQTDKTGDLIEKVQTAYANLQALDSYHSEGEITATQVLTASINGEYRGDFSLGFQMGFDVIPNGADTLDDLQGTTTIALNIEESSGRTQNITALVDYILLDGQGYTRVQEASQDFGLPLNTWVADTTPPSAFPFPEDRMSTEPFLFLYLVNPDTVAGIKESQPETRDGQQMHVISVILNTEALAQAGVISQTGIGEGTDTNLTASFDNLGALTAITKYTITLWIGADDGLPHYVEYLFNNDVSAEQQNANAIQNMTGSITYSGFNQPLTIENPLDTVSSGGDTDLISLVENAYADLQDLPGYRVAGEITGTQHLSANLGSPYEADFELGATLDALVIPNGLAATDDIDGTAQQNLSIEESNGNSQAIQVTTLFILKDGALYSRFNFVPANASTLPMDVWLDEATAYPNADPSTQPIPNDKIWGEPFLFLYLADASTITAIEELAPQSLNGQQMRVIDITFNIAALRNIAVISPTGIGEGTTLNLTASFDGLGQLTAESTYTLQLWIGADDGLPHYALYTFDNDVSAEQGNARAVQHLEGELHFTDHGTAGKISIPPLGE